MAANVEGAENLNHLGLAYPGPVDRTRGAVHIPAPRAPVAAGVVELWPVLTPTTGVRLALVVKEVLDRTAALLGMVCLLPLLLLIGSLVRATSPGPALYRHERVGRDGKPFSVWKFRTMRRGADTELLSLLADCGRNRTPLFKVPDDPRVTPVGRFLRRTSLDELPQLLNVLCGQMSLVGPRPQVAAEVALYTARDRLRLRVKPGITGLWQVSGRSDLAWEQAVEHDLRYVREWSLLLDVRILLRTIGVVLRREGAV